MFGYKSKRSIYRAYGIIFTISAIALVVRVVKIEEFGPELQVKIYILSLVFMTTFWELLRCVNVWLNHRLPFEKNISLRIAVQLISGVGIGLFIRFMIYYFGESYIPFEVDNLFLAATWAIYPMIAIGINLGFFTSHFIGQWKRGIIRTERLEREKSQVQFDNLRNQLNPHFLFNALTSLNSLIFEDQKLASDFLQQLSRVYRYVLQNKDKDFVSLKTELEFIQHYVSLLETRFDGALKITFSISPKVLDRAVVPVALQILIENAIKHNVVDKQRRLLIEVYTDKDYMIVRNNYQKRNTVETSNRQGLENLKSLYKFITDKPVEIQHAEKYFTVKLPLV